MSSVASGHTFLPHRMYTEPSSRVSITDSVTSITLECTCLLKWETHYISYVETQTQICKNIIIVQTIYRYLN